MIQHSLRFSRRARSLILLAAGGIYALSIVFRLYLRGVGLHPDESSVATSRGEFKVSLSLKNVGAVIMATSVAWAFLAYLALPTYKKTAQALRLNIIKILQDACNQQHGQFGFVYLPYSSDLGTAST